MLGLGFGLSYSLAATFEKTEKFIHAAGCAKNEFLIGPLPELPSDGSDVRPDALLCRKAASKPKFATKRLYGTIAQVKYICIT